MNPTDEHIRRVMRDAIRTQKLTQLQLAERLEVKQPSVAAVLSGKRGTIPQSLVDVLDVLGLELIAVPKGAAPHPATPTPGSAGGAA